MSWCRNATGLLKEIAGLHNQNYYFEENSMKAIYKGLFLLCSVVTLSGVSALASAKCSFDLRGTWQSYLLYANSSFYSACTFSTDREGNLELGSICDIYNSDGTPFNLGLTATGSYATDDNCNVTGSLDIGSGAGTVTILNARMSNGGRAVNGIQEITSGAGLEVTEFTMFRLN